MREFSINRCVRAHADLYEDLLVKVGQKGTYVKARNLVAGRQKT